MCIRDRYEAELSCLSKSSLSLAREEKNFAIFGSQQTTTLDRNLVSISEDIDWHHNWSAFSLTQVFFFELDSHIFFRLKFQNFDSCLKSWHLLTIFFLFLNIYISANLDSYFLLHSVYFTSLTYVLCFHHVFTIGIILSATERHKWSRKRIFMSNMLMVRQTGQVF